MIFGFATGSVLPQVEAQDPCVPAQVDEGRCGSVGQDTRPGNAGGLKPLGVPRLLELLPMSEAEGSSAVGSHAWRSTPPGRRRAERVPSRIP